VCVCLCGVIVQALMQRYYPAGLGPLSDVPHTGPSPVMARVPEWLRVVPRWELYTAQVGS
jgi:hypothetical protein